MNQRPPRILLIGAGAFGRKHLKTLLHLETQGLVKLAGVVVNTEPSRELLSDCTAPVHCGFSVDLLDDVDAVDIVTPVDTHAPLVLQCLPKAHVLVEKPLASTSTEASALRAAGARSDRVLMVGHIFRFHPVVGHLR